MRWIRHLLAGDDALLADRSRLALENLAPRQHVVALNRLEAPLMHGDRHRLTHALERAEVTRLVEAGSVINATGPASRRSCHLEDW